MVIPVTQASNIWNYTFPSLATIFGKNWFSWMQCLEYCYCYTSMSLVGGGERYLSIICLFYFLYWLSRNSQAALEEEITASSTGNLLWNLNVKQVTSHLRVCKHWWVNSSSMSLTDERCIWPPPVLWNTSCFFVHVNCPRKFPVSPNQSIFEGNMLAPGGCSQIHLSLDGMHAWLAHHR